MMKYLLRLDRIPFRDDMTVIGIQYLIFIKQNDLFGTDSFTLK